MYADPFQSVDERAFGLQEPKNLPVGLKEYH
jgi:hypothetical protein